MINKPDIVDDQQTDALAKRALDSSPDVELAGSACLPQTDALPSRMVVTPVTPVVLPLTMALTVQMQETFLVTTEDASLRIRRTLSSLAVKILSFFYAHRRICLSVSLLFMIFVTLFVQTGLSDGALQQFAISLHLPGYMQTDGIYSHSNSPSNAQLNASQQVVRVDSADAHQYYPDQYQGLGYGSWVYSSCSGIAMEEVMRAYGHRLTAGDVLREEAKLGVWSISDGLLGDNGITKTADHFGFNADLSHSRSLNDIVKISNSGHPVIVSLRGSYFPRGHILVVRGGDAHSVYTVDSNTTNFTHMSNSMFLGMWQGQSFSAVLTPRS